MSVESITKALNVNDSRLTPLQRLVLVGIANHDGDGGAWPSKATLCRYTGCGVRAVRQAIRALEGLGYVTTIINGGGSRDTRDDRRPNRYELHYDGGASDDPNGGASEAPPSLNGGASDDPNGGASDDPTGVPAGPPELSINHPEEPSLLQSSSDDVTRDAPKSSRGSLEQENSQDWFEGFWKVYPRKVGKPDARKKFKTALNKFGRQTVSRGLGRWLRYWREQGTPQNLIPHPATWLYGERFNDEPPLHRTDVAEGPGMFGAPWIETEDDDWAFR